MRNIILTTLLLAIMAISANAAQPQRIKLMAPQLEAGLPVMKALKNRHSERQWADSVVSPQDLSNLLWVADGVNRPDGHRTAPSALGKNDVDIYLFNADGAYRYLPDTHEIELIADGDHRALVVGGQPNIPIPPLALVYTTTPSRFGITDAEAALTMGYVDVGMVSENVGVFCGGTDLVTVPRATMDKDAIVKLLKLPEGTFPVLNDLIGYPVKQ